VRRCVRAWLLFLWAVAAVAETPADFAFGLPIEASGPQALFQLELPQAVYEGVLRADLADLRVFNAVGEPVPHAFLPRATASHARRLPLRLPFFALRGDAVAGVEGLEVRIERDAGRAVVTMNGRQQVPARAAALLGYLVDASTLQQPLRGLALELPSGLDDVVMRVRVEASDDLARWTTLVADAPVLRLQAGGQRLEQLRLEFPPHQARYLRLSWPGSPRPLPLAGLLGEPGDALVEAPRRWKQVAAMAPSEKAGEYLFDLGGQFPVDRLRLILPQPNTVAVVEILSRPRANAPWQRVLLTTVYRLGQGRQETVNPDLAVATASDRHWLLRVDQRGGGFGVGAPQLAVGWVPQRLVFTARGDAPFVLAYGSSRAGPAAYPIATLLPGYRGDDVGEPIAFPIGSARTGRVQTLAGESATREAIDWKRWTLWASLLLGVALLAWMAWRLARQLAAAPTPPSDAESGET
jgi:hypothetical protein